MGYHAWLIFCHGKNNKKMPKNEKNALPRRCSLWQLFDKWQTVMKCFTLAQITFKLDTVMSLEQSCYTGRF